MAVDAGGIELEEIKLVDLVIHAAMQGCTASGTSKAVSQFYEIQKAPFRLLSFQYSFLPSFAGSA